MKNRVLPEKKKRRIGLRILPKYLIVTISLIALTIVTSSIFFLDHIRAVIRMESLMRLETLSSTLAKSSMEAILSWDYTLLETMARDAMTEEDVVSVSVYGDDGRILSDSDTSRVGKFDTEFFNSIVKPDYKVPVSARQYEAYDEYSVAKSVFAGRDVLEMRRILKIGKRVIGAIVIKASEERMNMFIRTFTLQILQLSLGILILGIVVAIIFVGTLVRPINSLHLGAQKIGSGDLKYRIKVMTADEVGELADAFNDMAEKMDFAIAKLDRQNVELKELDRLKNEFLANTSHELRTPLNGITGLVESMLDGADGKTTPEQKKHLQMVRQCSISLTELVNNLLDLSKLESGLMDFSPNTFDLSDVIDTVVPIAEGLVKDKNIKIKVEVH
ncbi:MAG: HAMP domain-containing sensor histidine kinase [Candidatus Omnitrophica bacterium]|nr:HAMP domain-containing sensor histidine kinase [Candidatus Omnitrophota bacterium]